MAGNGFLGLPCDVLMMCRCNAVDAFESRGPSVRAGILSVIVEHCIGTCATVEIRGSIKIVHEQLIVSVAQIDENFVGMDAVLSTLIVGIVTLWIHVFPQHHYIVSATHLNV